MKNFQKNKGWGHILYSKPFLFVLGILILIFAWNVFGFWNKMRETEKNRQIAEDKISELKQRKDSIGGEIESLKTPEGKEKVFRENMGLIKDGEGLVIVVEDKNKNETQKEPSNTGFFSFLKNLFK